MLAAIMAALKAIPAIVTGIGELKDSIKYLQNSNTQQALDEFKAEMRSQVEAIKHTEDRNEMLQRIHDLNTALSK